MRRLRSAARLAVALALAGSGGPACTPGRSSVSTAEVEGSRLVVARADRDGRRIEVLVAEPRPREVLSGPLDLDLERQTLVVIGLDEGLLPAPLDALRLTTTEAGPASDRLRRPLPEGRLRVLDADGLRLVAPGTELAARLAEGLALELPAAGLRCEEDATEAPVAWSAHEDELRLAGCWAHHIHLSALDDTRLISSGSMQTTLLEAGQGFDCDAVSPEGRRLRLPGAGALAVDPRPRDGARVLLHARGPDLLETRVYEDGFDPATTTTVASVRGRVEVEETFAFHHVHFDASGATLVAGDRGLVLAREGDGPFVVHAIDTERVSGLRLPFQRIVDTGDPERPHALLTATAIYVGDARRGRLEPLPGRLGAGTAFKASALAAIRENGRTELWATGRDPGLVKLFRGDLERGMALLFPPLPPSLAVCSGQEPGTLLGEANGVVLTTEHAFLPTDCGVLLRIRRRDLCTSLVPLRADLPPGPSPVRPRALERLGDTLLIGAEHGQLYRWSL